MKMAHGKAVFLSVFEHFTGGLQVLFLTGLLLGQNERVERIFAHPFLAESQMLLVLADAEYGLVTGLVLP